MTYTAYATINSLPEFSFIAGNQFEVDFTVYQEDGINPMDIGGATVYWVLAPYGQPDYRVVQITGVVTGTNTFKVTIPSATSASLSGKYIHQPIIVSVAGLEYRPAQGLVLIIPQTPHS
jgi:hypothetical protein